jgi:adenylosuccinate lyase
MPRTPWPTGHSEERRTEIWQKGKNVTFDPARSMRSSEGHTTSRLTHLSEIVGPQARFVHQGMTSSDVLDTCFNVQLVRAADILIGDVDKLLGAIRRRAFEHKLTPTIGRSHGIHAEPTSFGLKLASAYAEFSRAKERLMRARTEVATCAISGAVGTFAQVDPRVEAHVAKAMGLAVEPVSTQIIPRDRHAMYFAVLGVVASSVERLATEIRHLQRTEVLEAEEFFSEGQKGSSAMPHKRNPVLSENVTGLARMVRAYVMPAMEDVALWHERDISHSSVERMIGPDATATLDFALVRLASIVDKMIVHPANMQRNLERLGGLVHSQRVLIALTQKGMAREEAYRLVQRNAMRVWNGEGDFRSLLEADGEVRKRLSDVELASVRSEIPPQARRHDFQPGIRDDVGVGWFFTANNARPCPGCGAARARAQAVPPSADDEARSGAPLIRDRPKPEQGAAAACAVPVLQRIMSSAVRVCAHPIDRTCAAHAALRPGHAGKLRSGPASPPAVHGASTAPSQL